MARFNIIAAVIIIGLLSVVCGFLSSPKHSTNIYRYGGRRSKFMCASTDSVNVAPPPAAPAQGAHAVNLPFDNIKNMRDLSSASKGGYVSSAKVFRTGCVSKASESDTNVVLNEMKIKTWIDLRSPAELHEDEELHAKVYDGFENFTYDKKQKAFLADSESNVSASSKKRFFISLMSESLIKKGVFFRLRKRTRVKAVALVLLSAMSRRAGKKVRDIFIGTINNGGLSLLNELVIDYSGEQIIAVMKLIADENNHPIGVYCTAGKDRTGLIAMLTLSVLGGSDEEILEDYVHSDTAYADLNDKKAMVASLKQVDVDPTIFLRANPKVMVDTMNYLRTKFGSINGFLDEYGFDATWRERMRKTLLSGH